MLATLADDQTLICSDELNHASIIDGIRLSRAGAKEVYPHGDLARLRRLLADHPLRERALVVTDGVFSMEGDLAPLPALVDLCREADAFLVVDDSHGPGSWARTGRGTAEHFGLLGEVDAVTGTLGKALGGGVGGFVAGLRRAGPGAATPRAALHLLQPGPGLGRLRGRSSPSRRLREDPGLLQRLRVGHRAAAGGPGRAPA